MKFLPLLWSLLWRNPSRAVLMALSIGSAFLLFGLVQAGVAAIDGGVRLAGSDRLIVTAAAGLSKSLPYAHRAHIEKVPGVLSVTPVVWFAASYQDRKNSILALAADPVTLFANDPSLRVPDEERKAFQVNRTGAIVGADLAAKYGWKAGDRIPLFSPWRNANGGQIWEFDLVGFYMVDEKVIGQPVPAMNFFFQYEYFALGQAGGTVSWYGVRVHDEGAVNGVSTAIDQSFLNSSNETHTQSERDFSTGILRQLGDVGSIGLSVMAATLFALVVAVGNSMMRTFRERVPELAVFKTLGFTNWQIGLLVFAEAFLLCVSSALAGLGVAVWLVPKARQALAQFAPGLHLSGSDVLVALACAVLLAALSAAIPVWRSARLTITQALSES